ncbi:MAG TPA: YraN family protein [Longilinea sp.]|nr:YraN family protein [Longilinea sp.]
MKEITHRQRIGKWGEDLAVCYLEGKGLTLVARNERTEFGEVDLIMLDGADLIFIEVKTRTTAAFGLPKEAISARKREHLKHSAEAYLQTNEGLPDSWRIDVIAIRGKPSMDDPEIEWFQNAVV